MNESNLPTIHATVTRRVKTDDGTLEMSATITRMPIAATRPDVELAVSVAGALLEECQREIDSLMDGEDGASFPPSLEVSA